MQEQDEQLLQGVKQFHREHGYSPSRKDLSAEAVRDLKARFRTWKNVLVAAGLPAMNDVETQRQRQHVKVQKAELEEKTV